MVTESILMFNSQLAAKTETNFNAQKRIGKKHLAPLVDTSILTVSDWERIRRNAFLPSREEMLNTNKIYGEQREAQGSKAKALKERLLSYDKTNPSKFHLEEFDKQFIGKNNEMKNQAQRRNDLNEDVVKQMNKLVLYAKIATIRDRQKEEQKLQVHLPFIAIILILLFVM